MDSETRVSMINYKVYWVTDNKGIKHLCHDPVYAQHLQNRYIQEAKQNADAGTGN